MENLSKILNYRLIDSEQIIITVKALLILIIAFILINISLKLLRKLINKRLEEEDKGKFRTVISFLKYVLYVFVIIVVLESSGANVSVILAGSAALLVGLGLGLQTLFQDIISGIFILLDKALLINDIIEIDGKVGKVFEIKLRTTRVVTIDNRVLIIPNHKFLTNILFNWTQNGKQTTESIDIGVAYGSDVEKVKQLLIEVANEHPKILKSKKPNVLFMDFGDSSLNFRLLFTINDSFSHLFIKSDLRFKIDEKFRLNEIQIPFPQRDVHLFQKKD
ncbi:mechanosensitive ion channel family protein [Lutibacter citreus]|uniref:mechanosensitive ion channel family protein n=1 Tax=Lutibacter citreus TaxID=2138210 RepID=UPI001FE58EBE|nr:mechanosensitive ion channel domain-containing protein [Lutibacter citreus]